MALQTIPSSGPGSAGAGTRAIINAAIRALDGALAAIDLRATVDLANLIEQRLEGEAVARYSDDQTEIQARIDAIAAERQARLDGLAVLVQGLGDPANLPRLVGQRFDFLASVARPGDNPSGFVQVPSRALLSGDGRAIADVPVAAVASGDNGRVVRLTGAAVVAQRRPSPIEQARVYRARYVVQRRGNPSDPSNDSVVLGILWLDAGFNIVAPSNDITIVEDVRDLSTAYGRQERAVLFSLSPVPDAQFRAPPRARYARAYVQSYGLDGVTDVEVLGIDDVSAATILAPETVDTVQRVGALESQNPGPRLTALESQVSAPNSVTFATKSDAASGAIANTVTTVSLRGLGQAGDGGDGIYKRISGTAAPGSDSFINQGVTFVRVFTSADVLGALLNSLPTELPPVAGRAWLNGGLLAVS